MNTTRPCASIPRGSSSYRESAIHGSRGFVNAHEAQTIPFQLFSFWLPDFPVTSSVQNLPNSLTREILSLGLSVPPSYLPHQPTASIARKRRPATSIVQFRRNFQRERGLFSVTVSLLDKKTTELNWIGVVGWLYKEGGGRSTEMADSPPTQASAGRSSSLMDNLLGLLRIRVKRGINLAVRDVRSSDPYVVVKMGKQVVLPSLSYLPLISSSSSYSWLLFMKLKTRVIKKDVNPVWNEDLTLSITDSNLPIHLTVFDHDTFTRDDKMGDAEFDIKAYIDALRMNLQDLPNGTIITRVQPSRQNCLAEESCIMWNEGKVVQDLCLRLRNVECGELEIQLQWIDLPGSKGL
ncbi:ADP-ribosylation factor GTPase-activating protein AGD12 [Morella rubra]|uniref:ADP-ribosylation factor GTPase-activating protein AGD12 n=1 Tax=Morella rubra TaxID=262757 RepID=A0A6A1VMV3_9ROSI|nr:ADP-ribosylation factor GTPase-activating protein AGD12 [Morella rubra]